MNTKNTGLILTELIIVLIIMGIVSAAVFITYRSNEETQLRAALTALQSDIRYAQKLSLTEGVQTEIVFSTMNNRYYIRKTLPNGRMSTIKTVELDNVNLFRVNAVNNIVSYTPRGTTGSACTITMQTNSYTGSLTVNVGSGRAKITELRPK